MARDLNKVILTGHLGADPEMRFTPQGSAVTTFRVASNRRWKTSDGDLQEDTEWFRVVAWDKLAEICNEYLKKGTRVYIEGRLQTRSWDDRNTGEKRYVTEVVAQDMVILTPKGDRVPVFKDSGGDSRRTPDPSVSDAPTPVSNRPARAGATRSSARNTLPLIEEDDVPF